jgi:hypothetical protein
MQCGWGCGSWLSGHEMRAHSSGGFYGCTVVYRGFDPKIGRDVAIKFHSPRSIPPARRTNVDERKRPWLHVKAYGLPIC